jgi:hypothetical protein
VKVNVEYGLTRIPSVIDYHAVTIFFEPLLYSDVFSDKKEVTDYLPVRNSDAMNVRDVLFGNDQCMDWRLGIHIRERQSVFVLVDDL